MLFWNTFRYYVLLFTLPSYLLTQNTDASATLIIQNINDTLTENKPRVLRVGTKQAYYFRKRI